MSGELASEAIRQLADKASEFLGKVANPSLEELGGLLADKVKFWRFKNQVNIVLKAEEFLRKKGVTPQKIPLKTLVPLLEQSSWEEDSDMQDRWASLLASAADQKSSSQIQSSYVELLKQLSPLEARMLDQLYSAHESTVPDKRSSLMFGKQKISKSFALTSEQFDVLTDNLFRLNLLQPPASHGGVSIGKFPIVLRTYEAVQLTPLACDFIKHCRYGKEK